MTKLSLLVLPLLLLLADPAAAKPEEWTIDKTHSTVGFWVRHLGVAKVRGKFKQFDGKIVADDKTGKVRSVEATARTASIDTGVEKRDAHLQSEDFFAAEQYPELKLVTKNVRWRGKKFTADVDLTIRDVTKTVQAEGELLGTHTVDWGGGPELRAGYYGEAKINRKDFNIRWGKVAEGAKVVSDEVTIVVEIEAYRALGATGSAAR